VTLHKVAGHFTYQIYLLNIVGNSDVTQRKSKQNMVTDVIPPWNIRASPVDWRNILGSGWVQTVKQWLWKIVALLWCIICSLLT